MTQREKDITNSFLKKIMNPDEPKQTLLYNREHGIIGTGMIYVNKSYIISKMNDFVEEIEKEEKDATSK